MEEARQKLEMQPFPRVQAAATRLWPCVRVLGTLYFLNSAAA